MSRKADWRGVALVAMGALVVARASAGAEPNGLPLGEDPHLSALVNEALERRPEVSQARALVEAERERVPQAGAFPDPSLTLGLQNDGFTQLRIGEAETSWVTVMASQTLPWYGKRGLREEVASLAVRQAEAELARTRLSVRAEIERGYVDLLLVRDQLGLLGRLETLWSQSEGLAKTRYEAGEGPQSDLLRAQLERVRLGQRRWVLEAEERRRVAVLNRLRGRPLDEAIVTKRSLGDLPDPAPLDLATATAEAESQSPELQRADRAVEQSGKRVELARREYFPDPALNAGVMPRGKLEPMWLVGVSFNLPVWAHFKQSRAVAEGEARQNAAVDAAETVRRLLRQRVYERSVVLEALLHTNHLYRAGLLVQSETTVTSTVAQYQVGRVTFASVLEVLAGYLSDVNAFFESVAAIQRVAIAQRELSLEPLDGAPSTGMGASVPGAGGIGSAPSGTTAAQPPGESGGATPVM